ncbi:MAG: hypothetical protein FJY10_03695 [Bacteroidetes bacterium]|nr:hypothetical protein [Bacteroidota bacterium]
MKNRKLNIKYILVILGVAVLLNIFADRFFFRLDFTADKRFTLSRATRNILDSLEQNVTIKVFFSESLPPDLTQLRRDFQEMLIEYQNRSGDKVVFEFINPNKEESLEKQAIENGINPVLINVREKDQLKQQKAYLGAVLQCGDKKDVIPLIRPGAAMEYSLSTSIKKLTVTHKPVIGFVEGHGEPSLNSMIQAMQALSVLYDVKPVKLEADFENLEDYKTLVILGPQDSIPPSSLQKLDAFLASGRDLFVGINRVSGNFQTTLGSELSTGLEKWLESKGLRVNPDFIIDQRCGQVMVSQQQGVMTFQSQVAFPYFPMITEFADNPATKGLSSVVLQFASSMDYTGTDPGTTFTTLATSSDMAGILTPPIYFNINNPWQETDFQSPRKTLAGVLNLKGARLFVISDGDFAVNGEGQQAREMPPDNINLLVNGIEWLSDDTGLIDLRSKEVVSRPLDQLKDGTRAWLKYINFLGPILLTILFGYFRWQYRRNQRMKRMADNYI